MNNKTPAYRFDLVKDALEWIEQHPHKYDQEEWAVRRPRQLAEEVANQYEKSIHECGTAYCLAGVIIARKYGEGALRIDFRYQVEALRADPSHIRRVAEEILDMGDLPVHQLWHSNKSLVDLYDTYYWLQGLRARQQ